MWISFVSVFSLSVAGTSLDKDQGSLLQTRKVVARLEEPTTTQASTWEAVNAIVSSPYVISGDFVELPNGPNSNGNGGLIEFAMNCDSQVEGLSLDAYVKTPSGGDDSFLLQVAGSEKVAWHLGTRDWAWSLQSPTFALSAGYNSIKLLAREDGVAIQTLRLTEFQHCVFVEPTKSTWEAVDAIVTSPYVISGDFVELPNGVGDFAGKGLIEFAMNCDRQVEGLSLDAYVNAPSGGADSFLLQVAGSEEVAWHLGTRDWAWSLQSPTFALSAGKNSIKLLAREDGVAIQTLRLTGHEHCVFVEPKSTWEAVDAVVTSPYVYSNDFVELLNVISIEFVMNCDRQVEGLSLDAYVKTPSGKDKMTLKVAGSEKVVWHTGNRDWAWSTQSPTFSLSAGKNSIKLLAREDGVAIQTLRLTESQHCVFVEPKSTWEAVNAIVTSPYVISGDFVELPNGAVNASNDHKGLIEFVMNCDRQVEGLSLDAYVNTPSGKDDAFFLQVAESEKVAWHTGTRDWAWSLQSPTFALSAGRNSIKLLAREDGVAIQTLRLTEFKHCVFV